MMGTRQDKILELLKENDKGMMYDEIAEEMNYPKTKISTLLRRLRNFKLVEYKVIDKQKIWFYAG